MHIRAYRTDCKTEKEPIGSVLISTDLFTDEMPHTFLFNFHKVITILTCYNNFRPIVNTTRIVHVCSYMYTCIAW